MAEIPLERHDGLRGREREGGGGGERGRGGEGATGNEKERREKRARLKMKQECVNHSASMSHLRPGGPLFPHPSLNRSLFPLHLLLFGVRASALSRWSSV
jgi:hypothetical protein